MTPELLLRTLCEQHALPYAQGLRLLPLVRRAFEAPRDVRDRILSLVDRNLREQAERMPESERLTQNLEDQILMAVARVLHDWSPSEPLLDISRRLSDLELPSDEADGEAA
ncbi:MAG: hypothetical protein ACKO32_10130 [Planctomycetia bacterium]